MKEKNKRWNKN